MREIKSENPRKVKIVGRHSKDRVLAGTDIRVFDAETDKPLDEVQSISFSFSASIDDAVSVVGEILWIDFEKLKNEYNFDSDKFFADPNSEVIENVEIDSIDIQPQDPFETWVGVVRKELVAAGIGLPLEWLVDLSFSDWRTKYFDVGFSPSAVVQQAKIENPALFQVLVDAT